MITVNDASNLVKYNLGKAILGGTISQHASLDGGCSNQATNCLLQRINPHLCERRTW